MIEYLKDKRFLMIGGAIVGSILIYGMFSKKDTHQEIVMTAQGLSEGNLALIGKAQEFALKDEEIKTQEKIALASLENDRYVTDAGVTMLKEQNHAYLTGLEASNQFALASQVNTASYALMQTQEANALSRYMTDSNERVTGEQIGLEHAKEGTIREKQVYDYNLKTNEVNQSYALQNYQTTVQHDLGKKQIKQKQQSSWISGLTSVAKLFV
jgi:hypothetical protein